MPTEQSHCDTSKSRTYSEGAKYNLQHFYEDYSNCISVQTSIIYCAYEN